jgi:anti-sigma factor RsiW
MTTTEQEDEHTPSGAYVLNALDEQERAEFERHLAGCPLCSADVPAFREVLAEYAARTTSAPPPQLITRALSSAHAVRQERVRRGVLGWLTRRTRG